MASQGTGTGEPFVVLPFLPPSSNNIYVGNGKGGRFLSPEAKKFKTRAVSTIQTQCLAAIGRLDRGGVYRAWYVFYFPPEELINKTFGSGAKTAAVSRYKKMDVENRSKLVSDALATAIGIDDCQFFEVGLSKVSYDLVGRTSQLHIFLHQEHPGRYGLEAR